MNSLRIRFAIGFSLLFTVLLAIALFIVYVSYAEFRAETFYKRMKDRALTTFKLLIEVEQIDRELLQLIDKNTLNSLYDEKLIILQGDTVVYSSIDDKVLYYDTNLVKKIKAEKELYTTQNEDEFVGIYIQQNNIDYVLLSTAYDKNGRAKLAFLKWVMILVYFLGLILGWVAIYFFVRKIIRPLDQLKQDIQNIHSENLHTRLRAHGQGEEVDSLAANFNQMLERIQQSFSIQKDFVHYASHELRTPLAAMVGITENALNTGKHTGQHEQFLRQLMLQLQNLTGITNSLLLLSNKKINDHEYPTLRLDELVFRSVDIIQNLFPEADIQVNLEGNTAHEESLVIRGNEPLLIMAFNNLLKNAIQYSNNSHALVIIKFMGKIKEIDVSNTGEALSPTEAEMVFAPFFRGGNARPVKGNGLGLSLVKQIAELHQATIRYHGENGLNIFTIAFTQ